MREASAPCVAAASGRALLPWSTSTAGTLSPPPPPRDSSHSFLSVLRNLLDFILCSFPQSQALWSLWEVIAQYLLDSVISVVWLNTHTIFDITTVKIFSRSLISLLCLYLGFGPRFQIASQARFCEVSSVLSPASPC